jgi:hypothetical protein
MTFIHGNGPPFFTGNHLVFDVCIALHHPLVCGQGTQFLSGLSGSFLKKTGVAGREIVGSSWIPSHRYVAAAYGGDPPRL